MALTAQEEAELQQLEQQQAGYEDANKGNQAVDQVDQHRLRPVKPHETLPFSGFRAGVGMLRDTAQDIFNFTEDVGDELQRRVPLPVVRFGHDAGNGLVDVVAGQAATDFTNRTRQTPQLPGLKGEEHAGTAENVVRTIGSFVVPFAGAAKTLGVAKAASWLGRAGRAMAAGGIVDATMNPETTNLANTMRDVFGIDSPTLNALASEPDDNRLVARFKAAAVNAPVGLAADAVFEAGLRGVRAYRAWRGSLTEADAAVKAARADLKVTVPAEPIEAPVKGAKSAAGKATSGAGKAAQATPEAAPEPIEDAFAFLKRKAAAGVTDEEANAFAETFLHHPEEALSRAGINPVKIDFSAMDNPEMLGKLHAGLQDIYEGIANRLGRTGSVVTEEMTARAARVMATTSDVLKDLYGHTANLDAVMYASQAVVGSHAQKLVSLAELALKAAKSTDGGEQEWLDFLEAFHRHAYFLGALRGAGSEVGRALRSLQMVQKVGVSAGKRALAAAGKGAKANEAAAAKVGAHELAATATDSVSKMAEPAERILFLGKLIDKGGDVGDLSRFTRTKAGSVLQRLKAARGELRGNLFTAGTGLTNVGSSLAMQGLRGLSMSLASLKALALSPFGKTYAQAARVQTMATWFYVEGTLGAWRGAWDNMLNTLKREGMEEVVLNAEAWGAHGVAKKAAIIAEKGRLAVKGQNYERIDVSNRTRAFVMSSADMRSLHETIQTWNTPALMQHSMMWFLKAVRPAINAAGSLSRLGTILFINGADEFGGTLAAKAGAQAEAIRLAGHEAAELQLEGKPLGDYLKARMVQLTETVDGFADDSYSAGQAEAARAAGELEAKGALFQDPLEVFQGVTHFIGRMPLGDILVPFVRTPLRILERTAIDYTPIGLLKDRVRADIMAGGPRRDQALAQIGLGTMLVYTAFQMAEDRGIVGNDGDYMSSARLSRPSYSLKIGDDVIEFKRFDPVGTLLGWGADFRAYLDHESDKPPAERGAFAEQIIEAAVWATQANVLSKTWLTSLRDIVDLASSTHEGQSADGWGRYLQSLAQRFVPAAGIQKQIARGGPGVEHEASGFMEGIYRTSFGATKLPIKRDGLLGRPVPVESGDRLLGLKAGPGPSDLSDPLLAELDRLSFDIGKPSRSFHGVRLNSSQYSRLLELRGQIVTKDSTGLTLEGALGQLIKLPEYKALPRNGKVQAIRDEISGYTDKASAQLVQEDHELARHVAANQVWDKALLDGTSSGEVDRQTQELFQQLGLSGGDGENPQQ